MTNKAGQTVYTTGVYDIIHAGHMSTLQRARALGDRLVVGVQEDNSVAIQKGKPPVMSTEERVKMLLALPFVDDCVTYSDVDQRPMLDKIQPDIMVQTEEWVEQSDRTAIIQYCVEKDIRLVMLPIKKDMSSTIIKQRVLENAGFFRNDLGILEKQLRIISIDSLSFYEMFDPSRTGKLKEKIAEDNTFFNPIVVAQYEDKSILIDGANRVQALQELGIKNVFAFVVDYTDKTQVHLRNNVHYIDRPFEAVEKMFVENNITLKHVKTEQEAFHAMQQKQAHAFCRYGEDYYLLKSKNENFVEGVNSIVDAYVADIPVHRLSELSKDNKQLAVKIVFPTFDPTDLVKLVREGKMLQSGVTWHQVKNTVIRYRVPLNVLQKNAAEANMWLTASLMQKVEQQDIRYYPSNIYICDEWE